MLRELRQNFFSLIYLWKPVDILLTTVSAPVDGYTEGKLRKSTAITMTIALAFINGQEWESRPTNIMGRRACASGAPSGLSLDGYYDAGSAGNVSLDLTYAAW